jgi:L-asparagine oxygenase
MCVGRHVIPVDATPWRLPLQRLANDAPPVHILESSEGDAWLAQAADALPDALRRTLEAFRETGAVAGALWLRGLPVDSDLPPTPTAREVRRYVNPTAAAVVGACARVLGEPYGYAQLDGGAVFRSVYPIKAEALEQSAKSSQVLLRLHTEHSFHPYRPRHVHLHCLRGAEDAATLLCSREGLLADLTTAQRRTLAEPRFITGVDYAFGNVTTAKGNGDRLAILTGDDADPVLRIDEDLMIGADAEAEAVLARLCEVLRARAIPVHLRQGDLLVIDNHRAAHGRSRFVPRFDGTDRWLVQVKTRPTLPPPGPDRAAGTRVIRTPFGAIAGKG